MITPSPEIQREKPKGDTSTPKELQELAKKLERPSEFVDGVLKRIESMDAEQANQLLRAVADKLKEKSDSALRDKSMNEDLKRETLKTERRILLALEKSDAQRKVTMAARADWKAEQGTIKQTA